MTTPLVLDCLEQAIWTRRCEGTRDLAGLVHHTDAGSQYTSVAFTSRLAEAGIDPSVGSVGWDAVATALGAAQPTSAVLAWTSARTGGLVEFFGRRVVGDAAWRRHEVRVRGVGGDRAAGSRPRRARR